MFGHREARGSSSARLLCVAVILSGLRRTSGQAQCSEGYWEMPLIDLCVNNNIRCTAQATSSWVDYPVGRLFDNNLRTYWRADSRFANQGFRIDFGRPMQVESVEQHDRWTSIHNPSDTFALWAPYAYYSGNDALRENNDQCYWVQDHPYPLSWVNVGCNGHYRYLFFRNENLAAGHVQMNEMRIIGYDPSRCFTCAEGQEVVTIGGGLCNNCSAGQYKSIIGSSRCESCAGGKYSSAPAASTCMLCDEGKYTQTSGASTCIACPAQTKSTAGSDDVTDCKCKEGYTGDDGVPCEPCPASTYKTSIGSGACVACKDTTGHELTGQTNPALCQCLPGYMLVLATLYMNVSGACDPLMNGLYTSVPDSVSSAWSQANRDSLSTWFTLSRKFYYEGAYPAESWSGPRRSIWTVENDPFGWDTPSAYRKVPPDKRGPYQAYNPQGTFGFCYPPSTCNEDWRCPVGPPNNDVSAWIQSTTMRVGSYQSVDTCMLCPTNTYTFSGDLQCTQCPAFSSSASGSPKTGCLCDPGYTGPNGGPCSACAANSYKSQAGNGSCISCTANSTSPESSDAVTDCKCVAGFTGEDGGDCTACAPSTYKPDRGSLACTPCHAHAVHALRGQVNNNSCVCDAGYLQRTTLSRVLSGDCDPLLNGQYEALESETSTSGWPKWQKTTDTITFQLLCTNVGGSDRFVIIEPVNTWGGYDYMAYSEETGCQMNSLQMWQCPDVLTRGFRRATLRVESKLTLGVCESCPEGTYKHLLGTSACLACNGNSSSASASVDATWCVCNAGYAPQQQAFKVDPPSRIECAACPAGKFKAGASAAPTAAASALYISREQCQDCAAGMYAALPVLPPVAAPPPADVSLLPAPPPGPSMM